MLESRKAVLSGIRSLLKQIVELLLRFGIQEKELSALVRGAYVDIAKEKFRAKDGKPCSVARVAMLTGLSRRTVKEVIDKANCKDQGEHSTVGLGRHKISTILKAWHDDRQFVDEVGSPKILGRRTKHSNVSFDDLVERFASDIPAGALLEEMLRVKALEAVGKRKYRVIERAYLPSRNDPKYLDRVGSVFEDFSRTVVYNTFRDEELGRFERRSEDFIPSSELSNFKMFVGQTGMAFLQTVDDRMALLRKTAGSDDTLIRVGVGTYLFEGAGELNSTGRRKQ